MLRLTKKKLGLYLLSIILFAFPFISANSSYMLSIMVMICIYAIVAISLDLLIGYGGQISIGHAGFLSIGGYTVALSVSKFDLPFLLALLLAGIITGLIGFIIGLPAVRLSGHFLAVVTLGFGISIPLIALNWDTVTGGYSGISVFRPSWLSTDFQFYYVILIITIIVIWMINNILNGWLGRAFVAIRESEVAAQATGINVAYYKTVMFAISSFFTGIAGGLYAYWIGFVSPNDFSVITSFLLLGMIVVGGLASIPGAVIGTVILTVLPELTSSFIGLTNIIIGTAIVIIILFRPYGIISIFKLKKPEEIKPSKEEGGMIKDVNI